MWCVVIVVVVVVEVGNVELWWWRWSVDEEGVGARRKYGRRGAMQLRERILWPAATVVPIQRVSVAKGKEKG